MKIYGFHPFWVIPYQLLIKARKSVDISGIAPHKA